MIRTLVLFLIPFASVSQAAIISAGQVHTCLWQGENGTPAVCWGDNSHDQLNSPPLSAVRALKSGAWHTCALHHSEDVSRISCWGANTFGQSAVPRIEGKPVGLAVGRWHSCGLWEKGAGDLESVCWGKNDYKQIDIPALRASATTLFAGHDYTCALLENGETQCWGRIQAHYSAAQQVGIKSREHLQCAEEGSNNVRCWTNQFFVGPPQISYYGRKYKCHLKNNRLSCNNTPILAKLNNIIDFAVGDWHACAINDQRVDCWGEDNSAGQLNVPLSKIKLGPSLVGWKSTAVFFQTLSKWVYAYDETFCRMISAMAKDLNEDGTLLLLQLTRPYLAGLSYGTLKRSFLSQILHELDSLTAEHSARLNSKQDRIMAVRLLAELFSSAKPMLQERFKVQLEKQIAALGNHLIEGQAIDTDGIRLLLNQMLDSPYLSSRGDMGHYLLERLIQ